ncbi:coiled-coil domain-containing protein 151, partial [Austrofundulus limnaeus]|uniref:Coiled-coil domain-containing protein 151 n=1 Tax=Austrofundulus limnaeus TaxID=52670 RepID=A0A2I4AMM9_AUSLI
GGRAAHESCQSSIQKNEEFILQLRQENKFLHKQLAEAKAGDEEILRRAFQDRGSEKHAFRDMSARDAMEKLDWMVLSKKKRLNAMKHTTQAYQQRLDELKMGRNLS